MYLYKNTIRFFLLFPLLFLLACAQPSEEHRYLFLGHPYSWKANDKIDPRLEQLNYTAFDQVWLGGDVCAQTTAKVSTLHYLDSIFNLSSTNTHWAVGNHDIAEGNIDYITQHTQRPLFYTQWQKGICLVILNTNLFWMFAEDPPQENCYEKEQQFQMLQALADTLDQASHLVVLHHHSLFNKVVQQGESNLLESFNVNSTQQRILCDPASDIYTLLYPLFVKIQQRGIQVLFIGGDMGMKAKRFEYTSPEGILFLGSGINNSVNPDYAPTYVTNFDPDQVLIVHHRPQLSELDYEFVFLDSLIQKQ